MLSTGSVNLSTIHFWFRGKWILWMNHINTASLKAEGAFFKGNQWAKSSSIKASRVDIILDIWILTRNKMQWWNREKGTEAFQAQHWMYNREQTISNTLQEGGVWPWKTTKKSATRELEGSKRVRETNINLYLQSPLFWFLWLNKRSAHHDFTAVILYMPHILFESHFSSNSG